MNQQLPTSFDVISKRFDVKLVDGLLDMRNAYGFTHFDTCIIEIDANIKNADVHAQTFWHEALHAMLMGIGRPELCADEHFVDTLADAISQVHKTAIFGERDAKQTSEPPKMFKDVRAQKALKSV